ncbi:hypothetical protein [Lentzea indica]|uniref:hypothetical protein n=1 Tax=Lentzea indica TaxID=2604800 RepID=UPI00143893AF|nr:hypothetical protein [Lentzea indica]
MRDVLDDDLAELYPMRPADDVRLAACASSSSPRSRSAGRATGSASPRPPRRS